MMNRGQVKVTLFGRFTISYGGKTISEPLGNLSHQSWLLLKYLIVNAKRVVPLDELEQELTLREEGNTDNTIRVRLRRGREILAPLGLSDSRQGLLLYARGLYSINDDYMLETDQREFDDCFAMAFDETDPHQALDACVKGLQSMNGSFLQYSDNSSWVVKVREQYDSMYGQLLSQYLELMKETKNYSHSKEIFERALLIRPKDTALHDSIIATLSAEQRLREAVICYSKMAAHYICADIPLPDFESYLVD